MTNRSIEIIAEIGQNWNGNMVIAENLIMTAKEAGADVAKFQLYDPRKRPNIDEHPYKEILLENRLTRRKLLDLKSICDRLDIEFMCSVIDADKVAWTEELGVKRYKVASKSIYDVELASAIVTTNKPVILSWGYYEVGKERADFGVNIKNMYCISKYPSVVADYSDIRVNTMFSEDGYNFYGISDHTPGLTVAIAAMSRGARMVEKHITMDRTMEGPDHSFSLDPEELRGLCKARDEIEILLYK
jgi:sialic acid synthase SpsE